MTIQSKPFLELLLELRLHPFSTASSDLLTSAFKVIMQLIGLYLNPFLLIIKLPFWERFS